METDRKLPACTIAGDSLWRLNEEEERMIEKMQRGHHWLEVHANSIMNFIGIFNILRTLKHLYRGQCQ